MNDDYLIAIENKLTGNIDEDFKFIMNEAAHFQKLGLLDMVRNILSIFEKKYQNEGKTYLINKAKEARELRRQKYIEIIKLEKEHNFSKAQEETVKLIDTFPKQRQLEDNQVLKSFDNFFESLYYDEFYKKNQKVIILEEPLSNYYFHLGFQLYTMEDYEGSLEMLDQALFYNEVSPDAYLLKANSYYKLDDYQNFRRSIDTAFKSAYNRFQLANCYIQLCKKYIKDNKKEEAYATFYLSNNYAVALDKEKIIADIEQLEGNKVDPKDIKTIKEILDKEHIQFGPSKEVVQVLNKGLQLKKAKEDPKLRKYFLSIFFELTHDNKFKEMIDELDKQINN